MANWRYEISLLVLTNILTPSLCLLVKYISTLTRFATIRHTTNFNTINFVI